MTETTIDLPEMIVSGACAPQVFQLDTGWKFQGRRSSRRSLGWPRAIASRVAFRYTSRSASLTSSTASRWRATWHLTMMRMPTQNTLSRLRVHGFIDGNNQPQSKATWIVK